MGPLQGIKILEIGGIGPGPFCGMLLSDLGAEVITVEKASKPSDGDRPQDVISRGRRSIALNLKSKEGVETLMRLVDGADGLYEGFRPGVMERLGIGPDECLARNPKLVYGRMTGWGQDGPLAQAAGHDINYIALTGALDKFGRRGDKPLPPQNLVGDYGGGGMFLAFGMVCAILEAHRSGKGQVVDASMLDGVAALMAFFYPFDQWGMFKERGTSFLAGGGHHSYDTYETQDGKYISVGALEPHFYAELVERAGLPKEIFAEEALLGPVDDQQKAQNLVDEAAKVFKQKTRDEWCELLEGTDACFAPVLTLEEAPEHPHNKARNSYINLNGLVQHAPAPRFSRTQAEVRNGPRHAGEDTGAVLADFGFSAEEIEQLQSQGALS